MFRSPFVFMLLVFLVSGSPLLAKNLKYSKEEKAWLRSVELIITADERKYFKKACTSHEARRAFIDLFWAKRDPDRETEENEFKEEFFRRVEYANEHFFEGPPGWKTDRGRMYIYFGAPDKMEQNPMSNLPNMRGWILWVYYRYGF